MNKKVSFIEKIKQKINDYIERKKRRREEEKKKKEEIKIWQLNNYGKYYSKPKVFFLTITGLFLGLFENNKRKDDIKLNDIKSKKILLQDEQKINNELQKLIILEKEIDNIKIDDINNSKIIITKLNEPKEKLNIINKEFMEYEQKYNKENIRQNTKVISELAVIYEKNAEKINKISSMKNNIDKEVSKKETTLLKKIDTKKALEKDNVLIKKLLDDISIIEDNLKKINIDNKENILIESKEQISTINKQYIMYKDKYNNEVNYDIDFVVIYKENINRINKLHEKIQKVNSEIINKESLLNVKKTEKKDLLETVEDLLNKELTEEEKDNYLYENLSKEEAIIVAGILNKIDKEDEKTKSEKEQSEEKKEEIKDNNTINKEKKSKIYNRTEEDLAEIRLMETLIYNNLKKQKKEIKKYKRKIEQLDIVNKKRGFFSHIMFSIRNISRIAFSLFPLSVFKNKKLGVLTSAIFVNNSIRNMRNSINHIEIPYIEYDKIASVLRKEKKETEYAIMICYDSLDQIEEFKKDFLLETGYEDSKEALEILNSINKLEMMVEARAKELDKAYSEIQKVQEKGKQKIKKLEGIYNK